MAHSDQLMDARSAVEPMPGSKHTAFQPLQQTAFSALEHAAFHKGLLKPFKGKGELMQFGEACSQLVSSLVLLATEEVLAQAERYPFTLLPIRMTRQSTGAGTVFLRWGRMDRSKMGVDLWGELVLDDRTPASLVSELLAMELQRITINMQISVVHSISRQVFLCASKIDVAEQIYQQRISRRPGRNTAEE